MIKTFIKHISIVAILLITSCYPEKETVMTKLTELSIDNIHEAYQAGSYNSQQLVSAYLERIQKFDENINAITIINPEALAIAAALDQEYKTTGVLRPLHGIPMIVKDNINTKGLPTTAGSLALQNFVPEDDAFIIQKLVAAGAIIIAKSNMAEWAFSAMHTESSTAGTTRNPYNLDHVPAGSSGGTAASIASNFAVIGLGTDTGNSIRGPSSHCALVGFRTTLGLISRSGIVPLFLRNDVVGPMVRTVEDATRIMEVMAGLDPDDPLTKHSEGQTQSDYQQYLIKDGLQGARIGVLRELSEADPDPEIKALFDQAVLDLQTLGAELIDPLIIPGFANLKEDQWCIEFRTDVESYLATYVKSDTLKTLEDIIRVGTRSEYAAGELEFAAKNSGRYENPDWKLGERLEQEPVGCLDAYTDLRRIAFRQAIEDQMDSLNLDAIIYPTWNNKPARIESAIADYKGDNSQIIAPHTGQPAFTVPMGYTAGNLPAGLQFLGRMYAEPTLIRLAYAYEQGTKHRKPATTID